MQSIRLANGTMIPQVGFGTFKIPREDTQRAVEQALELGYRHIDGAAAYLNEKEVGDALRATGMAGKVFVTTKLRNCDQGYDQALRAFEASREHLGLDVVDLYLIHWPCPARDSYVETWRALAHLREQGAVREIGVSNFLVEHLERLVRETGVTPAVDQIEAHPRFWQPEVSAWCQAHGVTVEAYQPLGRGRDIESAPVHAAAEVHGVTCAQVVLRWHVQSGRVVIPKSVHAERMRQNLDLFGFSLTDAEMASISALHSDANRLSSDPRTFESPQDEADMRARIAR
ncbi:MAG: aldo/keto reductase [Olsenella sp.]|jgi:diketogulonate reductase-like aldo/keto reductase|nr:aldo/keto reductase [Olsenella sp.]